MLGMELSKRERGSESSENERKRFHIKWEYKRVLNRKLRAWERIEEAAHASQPGHESIF